MTEHSLAFQLELTKADDALCFEDHIKKPPERRLINICQNVWYDKLTLAQKFSASKLSQYGYQLKFIRNIKGEAIAIFSCDDRLATVNITGDIDLKPKIRLRK